MLFRSFLISYSALGSRPDKWTVGVIWGSFMIATGMQWVLRISKFIIGFLMLRGKSSAWLPVLVILSVTIAHNFITFKNDYAISSGQTIFALVINFALFGFVLRAEIRNGRELEQKVRAARQARAAAANPAMAAPLKPITAASAVVTPKTNDVPKDVPIASAPAAKVTELPKKKIFEPQIKPELKTIVHEITFRKGTVIDFEGHGKFAEIIYCHEDELWLHSIGDLPQDITKKEVVLHSDDGKGTLRLKFHRQQGKQIIVFKSA